MIFLTHLAFALLIALLSTKFYAVSNAPVFIFLMLFGSVIPDIDIGTSLIGRHFKLVNFFLEHRGFCHSIIFMIFTSIIVFLITGNIEFMLAFGIGFFSHLLIDAINHAGIRFFWPSELKFKGFIKAGGLFDYVLFVILFVINVLIIFR